MIDFMHYPRKCWDNIPDVWRIFGVLILAGVLAVACIGFVWHHYHQPTPPGNHAGSLTNNNRTPGTPTPANKTPTPYAGPSKAQIELGFIAKGSGGSIWLAIVRQLRADPKSWGYAGDLNDKKALTKWVNHEAMLMLIEDGKYYHGVGDEVRTYGDVSYVLQKDSTGLGKMDIAEYVVTTAPRPDLTITISGKTLALSNGMTNVVAPSVATSVFTGASPTTGEKLPVSHWEYVYFPHG